MPDPIPLSRSLTFLSEAPFMISPLRIPPAPSASSLTRRSCHLSLTLAPPSLVVSFLPFPCLACPPLPSTSPSHCPLHQRVPPLPLSLRDRMAGSCECPCCAGRRLRGAGATARRSCRAVSWMSTLPVIPSGGLMRHLLPPPMLSTTREDAGLPPVTRSPSLRKG
jgi:hypothetical protein